MAGRPRIVANRILTILKDSSIFLSIDEVKDLLAKKGWTHGFNVVQRNLNYLLEQGSIVESAFEKNKFQYLTPFDAEVMFSLGLELIFHYMELFTDSENLKLWRLLDQGMQKAANYVNEVIDKRNLPIDPKWRPEWFRELQEKAKENPG